MSEYKEYKVRVYEIYTAWYNLQNQLHREDGPAIEYKDGSKEWFFNGKKNREDGPAIELSNGAKHWFINNKRHRENGPAIEWANGEKSYYINDIKLTEELFNSINHISCAGKVVEIDGKKYKLMEVK